MGQSSLKHRHTRTTVFLSHVAAFLLLILAAYWLRRITIPSDPLLQGYLQVISSLRAFVFVAVTLVCFQATQVRFSLILAAGFLPSAPVLVATSLLSFQFLLDELPLPPFSPFV